MRWAICMSIDRGFGSIFLEGDSLICYQALYSSDSSVPQRIKTIVQDISRKVSRFQDLSFSWVSRVANAAAHCFVEWSLNCNFVAVGSVGIGWCPPCLEIALVKDSVPLQFVCLVLIKISIHKKEKKKRAPQLVALPYLHRPPPLSLDDPHSPSHPHHPWDLGSHHP